MPGRPHPAASQTCWHVGVRSALVLLAVTLSAPGPAWGEGVGHASLLQLRQVERDVTAAIDRVRPAVVAVHTREGWGSGVVVSPDGLVLTAGHVSGEPGRTFRAVFPDGRSVAARSLGRHLGNDAGMIQLLEPGEYPHATLGPTSAPALGTWVVALGHPEGFEARRPVAARLGRMADRRPGTLQSDCTLVGGDSGGPLIDLQGRVIGVHSRIGGRIGLNYHVPAAAFVAHWDALVQGDQLAAGFLGITRAGTANLALVDGFAPRSPAQAAGVRLGDRVLAFDGITVGTFNQLGDAVANRAAGERVVLTVQRGRRQIDIPLVLGVRPEAFLDPPDPPDPAAPDPATPPAQVPDGGAGE